MKKKQKSPSNAILSTYADVHSAVDDDGNIDPLWEDEDESSVEFSEQNGVRSLHLGSELVQSAMKISVPHKLELAYTRCMMVFLLFNPKPKKILLIGLGGGSLVKFIFYHFPEVSITAVEINPQVVAAARSFFFLPAESDRFKIVIADGADYINEQTDTFDVILVDGYNDGAIPKPLSTQAFYEAVSTSLYPDGLMVGNFLGFDRQLKNYVKRINNCFAGGMTSLNDGEDGNIIVFAFKKKIDKRCLKGLQKRALEMEDVYKLPLSNYAQDLAL